MSAPVIQQHSDTDPGLESLPAPDAAQCLSFRSRSGITDAGLKSLLNVGLLSGVRVVDLGGCDSITDHGLAVLSGMSSLVRVCLEGCRKVTHAGIMALGAATQLRELDVSSCPGVDNRAVAALLSIPNLKVLRLCATPIAPEGFLESVPAAQLVRLDVSACPRIRQSDVPVIAAHLGMDAYQVSWSPA
ncbi:MAG: hypothetical protein IT464_06790 [Planctomycetes bacterium]|nr:hypothetical protein [Planctomycetota bacterium]